jgi:hypothetical protein
MTRLLFAAVAAFALVTAAPALAGDCHGDCSNCPHRTAAGKADAAGKDAPPCACSGGKECKCPAGCQCDHCAHKQDEKAPKAPAKS